MSRWGQARRRAIAAALLLTTSAVLVGSTASAEPEPSRFPAYLPASPGAACVPDDVLGVVNEIAWAEISRLGDAGLPVCDVEWRFVADRDDWWWWGYAEPADELDGSPFVWIVEDVAAYAKEGEVAVKGALLEQHVRTTVRHEFGHALTFLLALDDATLADLFLAELEFSRGDTDTALEASAEAIAVALTPDDETRTWFYDQDVPEQNVRAAELVLDAFATD